VKDFCDWTIAAKIELMADEIERTKGQKNPGGCEEGMNLKAKEPRCRKGNEFESREASRTEVNREDGAGHVLAQPMRWALSDEKGKPSAIAYPGQGQNTMNYYISYAPHK
jgi:hypothetical protein